MKTEMKSIDGVTIIRAENEHIAFEIAPQLGGRIVSVYNKVLQKEFVWNNKGLRLEVNEPGADYDTNFWGGIDELLPNDIPETIDGISYPDHGELWTAKLDYVVTAEEVTVSGILPLSGLFYQKTLSIDENQPLIHIQYKIRNDSGAPRHFLWKLHAALTIVKFDRVESSARKGKVVYAESSRFKNMEEFDWPVIGGTDASVVPAFNKTMDFFYLYDIPEAKMGMLSNAERGLFEYSYDGQVFPFQWYFASYGQFNDHYTAILEPASAMPVSVNEARELGQCTVLAPGEEIDTVVTIYAGPAENRKSARS